MDSKKRKIVKNLSYAFLSQGISLFMSLLMSLIVPKLLGVEEFGHWQLFIFYSGYVGFFHFGLNDGVYLKYGGINYNDMDKRIINSQFWFGAFFESIIALAIILIGSSVLQDTNRIFIVIMTGIYLIIFNLSNYLGYIFQAANETKIYSISVIINRLVFIASIVVLLLLKIVDYKIFIFLYVCGTLISLIYCIIKGKDIVFINVKSFKVTFKEVIDSVSIGIKLMFSAVASMLILGIARVVVDNVWGIIVFGMFSFSLTLTNFVMNFIKQVSIVLFPALRQTSKEQQQSFYKISRNFIGLLLPIVFIMYIPVKILLGMWLPQYKDSIRYLALLLPLCTYDGKMQMLCTTYFKVLRKEKMLLLVNVITMVLSTILSLVCGYVFENINLIAIAMVISIAFRSIVSEIYLAKLMDAEIVKKIIQETSLVILFMICAWNLSSLYTLFVLLLAYTLYLIINRDILMNMISKFKHIILKNRYISKWCG